MKDLCYTQEKLTKNEMGKEQGCKISEYFNTLFSD